MTIWDFKVDKPIFMILSGHSTKLLIDRWDEFKDLDVLWFSMNDCKFVGKFMKFPLYCYVIYCTHKTCNSHTYKHKIWKSEARGNSPFEFLLQANENDVKDLVFFGMDGYSKNPLISYVDGSNNPIVHGDHPKACDLFNANYPKDLKVNVYNAINPDIPSHYKGMTELSYDEVLKEIYSEGLHRGQGNKPSCE